MDESKSGSSIFSPGSEPSRLASSAPEDSAPSHSVNAIPSDAPSSQSIGRTSPAMAISGSSMPIDCGQMELPSISFAEDSHARTFRSPEAVSDLMESEAVYGARCGELLASYDRASQSWKTPQHSMDGDFTEFSETLPRSGWMRNGTLFQLPPLVRLTYEIERGSSHGFPTPTASVYGTTNNGCPGDGRTEYATKGTPSLETMARRNMWPTPTAKDCDASGSRNTETSKAHAGTSLTDAIREDGGRGRTWPTPTTRDGMSGPGRSAKREGGNNLRTAVQVNRSTFASPAARDYRSGRGRSPNGHTPQLPEQIGGQLNPDWVELLMGLPRGWTRLPGDRDGRTAYRAPSRRKRIASTDAPGSPPSATALSPISPPSSDEPS